MIVRRLPWRVAMVLAALLAAPAVARKTAEDHLLTANQRWVDAINRGDVSTGLSLMTDDAAIIGPAGPVSSGKAAVTEHVRNLTQRPGFHLDLSVIEVRVSADGRTGFIVGDSIIARPGMDARRQRLLTVWRRQGASWRCYLDVVLSAG